MSCVPPQSNVPAPRRRAGDPPPPAPSRARCSRTARIRGGSRGQSPRRCCARPIRPRHGVDRRICHRSGEQSWSFLGQIRRRNSCASCQTTSSSTRRAPIPPEEHEPCRAQAPGTHQAPRPRHPGTPAPRHPGTPAPRHPGTQAPRHPGTQAPRHPGTDCVLSVEIQIRRQNQRQHGARSDDIPVIPAGARLGTIGVGQRREREPGELRDRTAPRSRSSRRRTRRHDTTKITGCSTGSRCC